MRSKYSSYQDTKEIKKIITYLDCLFRNRGHKLRVIEKKSNRYMKIIMRIFLFVWLLFYFFLSLSDFEGEYVKTVFLLISVVFLFLIFVLFLSNIWLGVFYLIKDKSWRFYDVRAVLYDIISSDKLMSFDEFLLNLTKLELNYQLERQRYISKVLIPIPSIFTISQVLGISISYKEIINDMSFSILNAGYWAFNFSLILAIFSTLGIVSIFRAYKYKFYIHMIEIALFKRYQSICQ